MAPKVFITGTTGYIGGDVLYTLHKAHPDWTYSALMRTRESATRVQAAYPSLRPIIGTLDDSALLTQAAAEADIVIHTADASDHEGAARAIAQGLVQGHSAKKPGFWLHTGGTGILTYFDTREGRLGEWEDERRRFDDWDGVGALTSLPDEAFHRNVDKIVLETGTRHSEAVKTAILCPPTIYGRGRGPVSGRSRQAYELAKTVLERQMAPVIGQGQARWNNLHVYDLSELFVLLCDAAAAQKLDAELWGAKGYYIVENGIHSWSELARLMARTAAEMGYISPDWKEVQLSREEAREMGDFQVLSWGLNSLAKAERARRLLGWTPKQPSLEQEVPSIVKEEKERLG
ncbi:related to nucleoside-diphosphate-sugar epimerase [Lecanosticta acicola]|uniref:Related to nucleoside-diphosphate-sugar epimerase n=1 Tax=Lecanosticta acicola TaxID=111012 RepID=A0AAI8Z0B2_9PEZI|nr:related to nucleoside-diphosphate-sugar epimerase [Lecanosticta acicola]